MAFGITPRCPCCRDLLWHCWACWRDYHNGEKHNDYIPPEYYGQPMNEKIEKIMKEKYGIKIDKKIIEHKEKPYKEGIYH